MTLVLDHTPPRETQAPDTPFRPTLAGMSRARLTEAMAAAGVPEKQRRMRVGQLWRWLYITGATSFDQMTDISKETRQSLEAL